MLRPLLWWWWWWWRRLSDSKHGKAQREQRPACSRVPLRWLVTRHKYCQIVWKRLASHRTRKNDREESVRWVWWRSSRDWRQVHVVTSSAFPSQQSAIYLANITLWSALSHHYQGRLCLYYPPSPSNSQLSLSSRKCILAVIFSVLIQVLHTSSSSNHNSHSFF